MWPRPKSALAYDEYQYDDDQHRNQGKGCIMANKDKVKNSAQIAKGKVKKSTGKVTGNGQLEVEGEADQMKGNLKQAGEKVKDAFKE